jgi:hypothetical protein
LKMKEIILHQVIITLKKRKRRGRPSRGLKGSSRDGLAHDKWLHVKKEMAEEQILNKTLLNIHPFSRQGFASTHAFNSSSSTFAHT